MADDHPIRTGPPADTSAQVGALDDLASTLARERRLLEVLLFRLVELRLLMAAGEDRFLGWAADEVERATRRVREAELARATVVAGLPSARGGTDEPTLAEIIAEAPEPWATILGELRADLETTVAEISETTRVNRRLAEGGLERVRTVLEGVQPGGPGEAGRTYGPDRRPRPVTPDASRFRGAL